MVWAQPGRTVSFPAAASAKVSQSPRAARFAEGQLGVIAAWYLETKEPWQREDRGGPGGGTGSAQAEQAKRTTEFADRGAAEPQSRGRTRAPAGRQELQPVPQCEGGVPVPAGHRDPPG